MDARLETETIDYIALRRLQNRYADVVTRRAWPELSELFLPDAEVVIDRRNVEPLRLLGPGAVGDFIRNAIDHYDLFEFTILNTVIEIEGDRARSRMYMWELRHDPVAGRSDAYGLYQDEHRRVGHRWWFSGRQYQTLARTQPTDFAVFPIQGV